MAGHMAVPPSIGGIPTGALMAPAAAAGTTGIVQTPIQQIMAGGYPMEKMTLIALTLFPPTGIAGLNLQAVKNTAGAFLKFGSYVITSLYAVKLLAIYPSTVSYVLAAVIFLGPWYLFDAMNIFLNPNFAKEGFQPPIPIPGFPPPTPTDGRWLLTPVLLSLILATLPAATLGSTGIANTFAPGAVGGDVQKYMGYAVAGTGLLGTAFSLFAANSGGAQPPLQQSSSMVAPVAPQLGGGTPLPPLSFFANKLLHAKRPEAVNESITFLGVLGIVIAGGLAMGLLRNSAANAAQAV